MKIRTRALAGALLLLSASAFAWHAVDGLSVRRQPKEGDVIKLRLKGTLDIQGSTATYTGLEQQKVVKVDTDGSYTLEEKQLEGQAKFGDQQAVPVPDTGPYPMTYNADGTVREIKGDPATTSSPEAYRMSNLESIIDPGKPLAVGDSWTVEIKADDKTGVHAAKADYKVLGEEKVGNFDTIKLKATVKETGGTLPASCDATYWISKTDGSLVKSEVKWLNAPFPGSPSPINATLSTTRES